MATSRTGAAPTAQNQSETGAKEALLAARGGRPSVVGALEPLREPVFRALWTASVVSNLGTWMQNVGGAWLMTSLTPSPLVVALMQTATSLPMFLGGLPAGALADLVDRRKLLLFAQTWMLVAAGLLGGPLATGENLDLRPSRHLPEPQVEEEPEPEEGPVLVTTEYHVDPERAVDFRVLCARWVGCAGATARYAGGCSATRPLRAAT